MTRRKAAASAGQRQPRAAERAGEGNPSPAADSNLNAHRDQPALIVVLGASGDLAKKKIFPALFSLHCQGYLPKEYLIVGMARSPFDNSQFRDHIAENVTCRYSPNPDDCTRKIYGFLERCHYVSGQYDDAETFNKIKELGRKSLESSGKFNRVYYMAIPPSVFTTVSKTLTQSDPGIKREKNGNWVRIVVEKPFGEDRRSSDQLIHTMRGHFNEKQVYRIDHYLGKEVIQDLLAIRFANLVFEPIWNRCYVENVHITWKERIGVGDRAGYFDQFGIIRDVGQNHLMQILALTAMEPPIKLTPKAIQQEKIKVIQSIQPLTIDDVTLGQYAGEEKGQKSYLQEKGVPDNSTTPTFFSAKFNLRAPRWDGVPFIMTAGKAMDQHLTEIRVRFRNIPGNVFNNDAGPDCLRRNEMVIRVQPNEAIYLKINNKVPGKGMRLAENRLDFTYTEKYKVIPEAYEALILDVFRGDKSLFVGDEELAASWDVFTPLLHQLEKTKHKPELYPCGSKGPKVPWAENECGQ